ncbi:MAG: ABC transporter permease [Bacteroidales bacterium]|nr:ABC transporter permease [Bacteroidales bacterium]
MKEYIKIAWRNLWRNKRRTIITIASVYSALLFALIMVGLQIGAYDQMMKSFLDNYTGYIQIYQKDYYDNRSIDNSFIEDTSIINKIGTTNNVKAVIPRLESYALAISGEQSKAVIILGIDPLRENKFSNPQNKLTKGRYFKNIQKSEDEAKTLRPTDNNPQTETNEVIISEKLAAYLKTGLQDTITLLGQGYHGASAAGLFKVIGIIKLPNPDLDKRIIYMDIKSARSFFQADGLLTSILLNINDIDKAEDTKTDIKALIKDKLPDTEVLTYKENSPELIQQIDSDRASGYIFIMILYLIVGFGVLGTVLMMISERKKEFGVMVSIGMQKLSLTFIVILEMLFIGLIGIISAFISSIPVILFLHYKPIKFTGKTAEVYEIYGFEPVMPAAFDLSWFAIHSLIVFIIILLAIAIPVYNISRLNEIKALRN